MSVKETGRKLRVRQADFARPDGARRMTAALPIRLNLSRLEHELQTAVNGSIRAAAISLSAGGIGKDAAATLRSPPACAARSFQLPYSFKGIGVACSSRIARLPRPERIRKRRQPLTPAWGS